MNILKSFLAATAFLSIPILAEAAPVQLKITSGAKTLVVSQCSTAVRIETQNANGYAEAVGVRKSISFSGSSSDLTFFSDSSCLKRITSLNLARRKSSVQMYFRSRAAGSKAIFVSASGLLGDSQNQNIISSVTTTTLAPTTTTMPPVTTTSTTTTSTTTTTLPPTTTTLAPTTTTVPVTTTTMPPVTTTTTLPPVSSSGLNIDLSQVDTTSSAYLRFKTMVDNVVNGGSRPYGFSGVDAAYMYQITKSQIYCPLVVRIAEEQVAAAEAAIAAGGRPEVSGDSYLEVGPMISDVAVAYGWCNSHLTAAQRSRFSNYANQTLYNVWNYQSATWGGRSYPWSGWSVNNPGNNYYFSFIRATMYWALAANNQQYLDYLRNVKLPPIVSYYSSLAGGGSREGTGYGTAHMNLFHVYKVWRDSTGQDLANQSTHATDTIRYWVHATVPTRERFAPIGDQARDAEAYLFDYHRTLVLEARDLSTNAADRALASWWLNHISVSRMSQAFNFKFDLLPAGTSGALPSEGLIHYGQGTGHLFARTSWETNATWMSMVAGPYSESHAHQDQGSVSVYKNGWLAVTPNILSHSGINQETDIHNIVRFVRSGVTIRQVSHDDILPSNTSTLSILSRNNVTGEFTAEANLTPAYNGNSAIQSWRRSVAFVNEGSERVINIRDQMQVTSDTQAIFQMHTIAQPVVNGTTVVAGGMTLTVLSPANAQISVVSMAGGDYSGGYRIEVRGSQTEYRVQIRAP